MRCEECRESISALSDGEDAPGEAAAVDAHVVGCAACRSYAEQAARVTRLARTRAVEEVPDLLPALRAAFDALDGGRAGRPDNRVDAAGPGDGVADVERRGRWVDVVGRGDAAGGVDTGAGRGLRAEDEGDAARRAGAAGRGRWVDAVGEPGGAGPVEAGRSGRAGWADPAGQPTGPGVAADRGAPVVEAPARRGLDAVRVGLAAVAVGQVALAVAGIAAASGADHHGIALTGASMVHFANESSAWNLALGVAFGWVALQGRRSSQALVPLVAAFVGVLAVLSVPDLLVGRVDPERLVGHGLVVAGLVLLLVHRHLVRDDDGAAGRPGARGPGLRGGAVPRSGTWGGEGLQPTGRRAA